MSDDARITAPVTPELLTVLIHTEKFMAQYDDKDARLKDAEHYGTAAVQLEILVKAIVAAQTSMPLLGRPHVGAQFYVGAPSGLMRAVDNASVYLSTTATELLRKNQLSRYEKTNTSAALSHMHVLMGTIIRDVQAVARQDLSRIADKGVELLAATADVIAKIDAGDAQGLAAYAKTAKTGPTEAEREVIRAALDEAEPRDDNRCTSEAATGRCILPAGHRSDTDTVRHIGPAV